MRCAILCTYLNNNVVKHMQKAQQLSTARMQKINVNTVKVYTIVYKYTKAYCKRNNLCSNAHLEIFDVQTKACTFNTALYAFNNELNSLNSFKLVNIY